MKIACQLQWVADAVSTEGKYNHGKYKLDVCHISDRAAKALADEHKIKVKRSDQKGLHFTCRSKFIFIFKDDAGNVLDASKIGNGTKAVVNITGSYKHDMSNMHGHAPVAASDVVVTELVSYTHVDGGDEEAL